jgi:hypothetical protein
MSPADQRHWVRRIVALQQNTLPGQYRLTFDTQGYNGRASINYAF